VCEARRNTPLIVDEFYRAGILFGMAAGFRNWPTMTEWYSLSNPHQVNVAFCSAKAAI
jgi:hypothetical protein